MVIVGGGLTGLWTALQLARAAPGLDIVVLERERVGFGASGRHGGWVLGEVAGSRERYASEPAGRAGVKRLLSAMHATVEAVGADLVTEGIACDFLQGGTLTVARGEPQINRLQARLADDRAWGLGPELTRWLEPDELQAQINIPDASGALFSPHCARVQPARLIFGLACAVERMGVRIFERTAVRSIRPGVALTAQGPVRAGTVVRATEGYTADLAGQRRVMLPMNSSMIVTEPLPEALWAEIGWRDSPTLADAAHVYLYAQRTADGRIALGGRGKPYRYRSRTDVAGETPPATAADLTATLHALLPAVRGVKVARSWSGVLGVPRDWGLSIGASPGLAWAGGYVGEGVAAAHLAGRILAEAILDLPGELRGLPIFGRSPRLWEPEPLRWLAVRSLYRAYRTADRREARTGRPARIAALADRITGKP